LPLLPVQDDALTTNFFDAAMIEATRHAASTVLIEVLGDDITSFRAPSLAALGIRQCVSCGCTEECGCSEGCSWAGPFRCSRCAEPASATERAQRTGAGQ